MINFLRMIKRVKLLSASYDTHEIILLSCDWRIEETCRSFIAITPNFDSFCKIMKILIRWMLLLNSRMHSIICGRHQIELFLHLNVISEHWSDHIYRATSASTVQYVPYLKWKTVSHLESVRCPLFHCIRLCRYLSIYLSLPPPTHPILLHPPSSNSNVCNGEGDGDVDGARAANESSE